MTTRLALALARESAHAAVAEHFGLEIEGFELDWQGLPLCRYAGRVRPGVSAVEANLVILLAGLVGERLARGEDWQTAAGDVSGWADGIELDPNNRPESAFEGALVLALEAAGGDVARLQALERDAHALLTADARVARRWEALGESLAELVGSDAGAGDGPFG